MKTKWTKESVFEESRNYQTIIDFRKGNNAAYNAAQKNGWLKEITWLEKPIPWRLKWTKEAVFKEASKYSTLDSFRRGCRNAHYAAYKKGWLEEMIWLRRNQIKRGFWKSKDNVLSESRKYTSMKGFREGCNGAYNSAKMNNWLEEMTWLEKKQTKPPFYWKSKSNVFQESKKYTSRVDFRKGANGAYVTALKNGWLDDMTWLARRYKEKGFWDKKENVFEEAKKYTYKSDFHRLAPSAYCSAKIHHWFEEMDWFRHKNIAKAPSGHVHVVYVYIDEDNKKAYVGATNDIRRRDYEHKTKIDDPLYKYYKTICKEIPMYKILVKGLTIIERQREEQIQSLYFRDVLHYTLLNNINLTGENIGSIGCLAWKWTRTDVIKEAEKYKTPKEFFTNAAGAYDAALRYKMMNENNFPWFYSQRRPQGWWNIKEHVFEESKKYKTWDDFFWKSPAAYNAVKKKHKCEDEMPWLERTQVPANYWQNESHVIEESKKYKTRTAFHKGCHAAYDYSKRNNLWDKMPWIKMETKEKGFWSKNRVIEEGKKYTTKADFKKGSRTAYAKSIKYHWIDEMSWFVSETVPRGYWQEKYNVMNEGKKYLSRNDFRWGNPGAYKSAIVNGWIEEMTWLTRPSNYNLKWTKENVFKEAQKYTSRGSFKKEAPSAYNVARKNKWLSDMNWLSSIKKKIQLIRMIRYKKCVCVRSGVTLLTRELEHCKNHLILAQLMKYIAIFATNYPTTFSGNNHNDLKTQIFYKMKHFIFILFANIFAILNAQNTSVTIYYDKNLKGVSDEAFATYKAVFAEPTDTNYQKQFVITYLPSKKTVMEGIYYSYDRYNHEKSKFKEYKTYDKEGILVSTVEGDSSNYVLTYYYPNGKKSSETQVLNGEIHGDMIIYKNEEDVTIYVHFDHGKQVSPTDYYCRGVHTQYAITAEDTSGKLIIETVSVNDRTKEKDSQGCTWMKYVKNGLVIQASCLKGNEYGNYWTLQFIFTNYGRDWRDLCADSLFVHGIKDGNQINMEKIPMSTYMKKVKKKHANRRFWDSFAESLVTADAGKYTSSSSVSVGNKHYRVESTYYDRVERNEALRESQERQNAYSKALMEEREELANNYFKSQPLNPRETVFGVQCLKLIECDEIIAELFIDGQKYVFEWAIE